MSAAAPLSRHFRSERRSFMAVDADGNPILVDQYV